MPNNPPPPAHQRPVISICGSSVSDPAVEAVAEELGRLIVQAGWVLACGGRGGVMEAASRGGQRARVDGAQGLVLGILPGSDRTEANPYLDLVIPTGIGYARNSVVVLAADVVMLVCGSTGTLSEAAYAWHYGKPVIALPGQAAGPGAWQVRPWTTAARTRSSRPRIRLRPWSSRARRWARGADHGR